VHVDKRPLTGAGLDFALREVNLPSGPHPTSPVGTRRVSTISTVESGGMPIMDYRNDNLQGLRKATGYTFLVGPVLRTGQNQESRPWCMYLLATTVPA